MDGNQCLALLNSYIEEHGGHYPFNIGHQLSDTDKNNLMLYLVRPILSQLPQTAVAMQCKKASTRVTSTPAMRCDAQLLNVLFHLMINCFVGYKAPD